MKCCICGKKIEGHGHNPWPYIKDKGVKCCDECNGKVLVERVYLSMRNEEREIMKGENKCQSQQ